MIDNDYSNNDNDDDKLTKKVFLMENIPLRFMFSTPGPESHRHCKFLIFSMSLEHISTIDINAEGILGRAS